jgi:probable rRNA maturation factor
VLPLGRTELLILISQILDGILDGVDTEIGTWELRITTDQPMARLHALYLKRHTGPTNVLAFPAQTVQGETADGLGFIVINADAVMREAYLYGQDSTKHFSRLLTHALLHLAGFDHGQAMEELTESVVQGFKNRGSGQAALMAAQDVP